MTFNLKFLNRGADFDLYRCYQKTISFAIKLSSDLIRIRFS